MDQLLANLQAALAALRTAQPNPAGWSGPAATAFGHRVDLLEIELVALSALVSAAAANPAFNPAGAATSVLGSAGNALGGAASMMPGLQQLIGQLGIHF